MIRTRRYCRTCLEVSWGERQGAWGVRGAESVRLWESVVWNLLWGDIDASVGVFGRVGIGECER